MKVTWEEFRELQRVIFNDSKYPKFKRKNKLIRAKECILQYFADGCVDENYNNYGNDLIGADYKKYITQRILEKNIFKAVKRYGNDKYMLLLSNKYLFSLVCSQHNLPQPLLYYYHNEGNEFIFENISHKSLFSNGSGLFLKLVKGYGGFNIKYVSSKEELLKIKNDWENEEYIIQQEVHNIKALKVINPKSLNTIRIVTGYDKIKYIVLASVLRCGTKESGKLDNFSSGGMAVGIDNNGYLMKYGYLDNGNFNFFHPVTKIVFEGLEIPFYEEAVEVALKAHKVFNKIPLIGWDIAITNEGPILIEGNQGWSIKIMQICHGGLKKECDEVLKKWYKK